jgi:amidase
LKDATALAEAVRRREVSPVELVDAALRRIEAVDDRLNAFVTVCADEAVAAARGELPDGPFRGVPLPVKDLVETKGIRTTFSSRAFADFVPDFDRAVVRRLRAAGFVVIGKTNTPEFGTTAVTESELNGACRNPWDTSRTPGGSSGGAAACVAAGVVPAAHASDGGGSIRIPASCCGLFGIKPSRGRISPAPYGDLYGLSTNGPVTWTVRDAAALVDAMAGAEPGDPYAAPPPERPFAEEVGVPPGRLRVAVTTVPPGGHAVDAACARAAGAAAELLAELGHDVEETAPSWAAPDLGDVFRVVWQTVPAMSGVDDVSQLEPMNRALAERAYETSSVDYLQAVVRAQRLARDVVAFWDDHDVVLTPTLALPPVPVGWVWDAPDPFARALEFTPFTPIVNVTGQPAVSVPFAHTGDGLPLGVQLIGPPFGDALLFRLAAQLEEARPWVDHRPPLVAD